MVDREIWCINVYTQKLVGLVFVYTTSVSMLSDKQKEAIEVLSGFSGEFMDLGDIGLKVAEHTYRRPLIGIDWWLMPLEEIGIGDLFLKHGSIQKNKVIYQIKAGSWAPIHVSRKSSIFVIEDGNHRAVAMNLLGLKEVKCHLYSEVLNG